MEKNIRKSAKKIQIDKANSTIVAAVCVAAFLVAFSIVAANSLLSRRSYQAKVIATQEKARDQLIDNIEAVDELKKKYSEFVTRQENIIKGDSRGRGDRDGDNAKIILDALPSKYDFPALASSLEKILVDRNYTILSISGTDDEVTYNTEGSAQQQQPVEMPFEIAASGSYDRMIELLGVFKRSIRPVYIDSVTLSAGGDNGVQLSLQGKSYFQPERSLKITEEVVQ